MPLSFSPSSLPAFADHTFYQSSNNLHTLFSILLPSIYTPSLQLVFAGLSTIIPVTHLLCYSAQLPVPCLFSLWIYTTASIITKSTRNHLCLSLCVLGPCTNSDTKNLHLHLKSDIYLHFIQLNIFFRAIKLD